MELAQEYPLLVLINRKPLDLLQKIEMVLVNLFLEYPNRLSSLKRFHYKLVFPSTFSIGRRSLSSEAGLKHSEEEDDSKDGFSELETPPVSDNGIDSSEVDEWKFSESDDDLEVEAENDHFAMSNAWSDLISCKGVSVHCLLDKCVEEGIEINYRDIKSAIAKLRLRRMYGRALQLLEWLEKKNYKLDFKEWIYAPHLDLIARIHGIFKAEIYFEKIPESFRSEVIYRTFLAHTVKSRNSKKAEETVNKMKSLGFQLTTYACNQLLLVYKRTDKKKIADVLLLMDKENINPNLLTYKLLIDLKGESNDIIGMEKVEVTMKAKEIRPDYQVQAILGWHYINAGHKEKAMVILKEMEGGDLKTNRGSCRFLLTLYAALGSSIDVERIWKFCETSFSLPGESKSAIEAWGKLNNVKKVEAVFKDAVRTWKMSPML